MMKVSVSVATVFNIHRQRPNYERHNKTRYKPCPYTQTNSQNVWPAYSKDNAYQSTT